VLGAGLALVAIACRQQPTATPQPGAENGAQADRQQPSVTPQPGAEAGAQPGIAQPAGCGDARFADVPVLEVPASMSTEELVATLRERIGGAPVRLDVDLRSGGRARGDAFVKDLVAAGALAGVRELRLAGNGLGPEAMRALAGAPELECLQRLDLGRNPVTDEGFALLCAAGNARHLRELVLDRAGLTGASLARLPGCAWSASLEDLSLADNNFGEVEAGAGARTRAAPGAWSRMVSLDLSRTRCRAPCLKHLRDGGLFRTLQSFLLEGLFGPKEARILAAGKLERLTTLQLAGMADLSEDESDVLGDAGLKILIASPMFARLERLTLPLHGIGDRGAASLASSPHGKRLRYLELRANAIGDDGVRALMKGAYTGKLEHLGLADMPISDDVADALRAHFGQRVQLSE
jgi:hypothetical protein